MPRNRLIVMGRGVAVSAAVALLALYLGWRASLPEEGFVPASFVTHSAMLGLSLVIMWKVSRGRLAEFGFTRGTYRFRARILLWVLPTAVLSLIAVLASGPGEAREAVVEGSRLRLVLFVWIYASVCEEVLTRGLLQTMITPAAGLAGKATHKRRRLSLPVVVSGLFFGAMHLVLINSMGPAAVGPIVFATLLGFLAAWYRETTGSLIPAIIVHALFNVGGMSPGWIVTWLS
jgi:membrane protease YdiL (CAAX protease family)